MEFFLFCLLLLVGVMNACLSPPPRITPPPSHSPSPPVPLHPPASCHYFYSPPPSPLAPPCLTCCIFTFCLTPPHPTSHYPTPPDLTPPLPPLPSCPSQPIPPCLALPPAPPHPIHAPWTLGRSRSRSPRARASAGSDPSRTSAEIQETMRVPKKSRMTQWTTICP